MTIKIGLAFASSIAIDGDATMEICRRAEAAGFESLWGGEHVILPSTIESSYPYTSRRQDPRDARHADPGPADLAGVRRSRGTRRCASARAS